MAPAKILVVDDEAELERLIRQRFRKKIRAQETSFLFAQNGVEALDHLQVDRNIDIVITDINMPQMDGLTFLGQLSQLNHTVHAVVMSAYSDLPNIRQAMNRGAFDFLTKPIDFCDLEITIKKTLESVQQLRQKQQQLEQAQQALMQAAYHDALTNLPNRSWFTQRLSQLIQTQDCPYAVLFIDLDRFKLINDSLGHLVGDLLLQHVAQRLQSCLQPPDAVARLGGDEFAIVLEGVVDVARATAVAKAIQEQLRQPFQLDEIEVYSEASIGIAISQVEERRYEQPEELLRDADVAMYCAKAQGKGRFEVFDPIMQIQVKEYLEMETDLRRALLRGELSLHYQPIISTVTGKLHGLETLVRWQHPHRGFISPSKFIPLAEETRLVVPLGWWVFEAACHQLHDWQWRFPQERSLKLNINFSTAQLQQTNLTERIKRILETTGVSGESLKLEITESYLLENISAPGDTLQSLKDLGIQLCIDDFGIGYSSLSRLHEFPIDILKIDRSFVQRVNISSGTNLETIKMIVTLAHSLGMEVVAEGVETSEQLQKLQELGCNFVQGYLFSRPVDSKAANEFFIGRPFF